jgi:hypothetical protein
MMEGFRSVFAELRLGGATSAPSIRSRFRNQLVREQSRLPGITPGTVSLRAAFCEPCFHREVLLAVFGLRTENRGRNHDRQKGWVEAMHAGSSGLPKELAKTKCPGLR